MRTPSTARSTHRDHSRTDTARDRDIERRCARHAKHGTDHTRHGRNRAI
jgi:hypothetical protein